jgi:hypothetical protein
MRIAVVAAALVVLLIGCTTKQQPSEAEPIPLAWDVQNWDEANWQ